MGDSDDHRVEWDAKGSEGVAYLGLVASVDKCDEPPCLVCKKKV